MNGKLIDYYIVAALIVCCIVFGIIGGVWSSQHGYQPMLAFATGCLCFVVSIGFVLVCCSLTGISFDVVKIFLKKGKVVDSSNIEESTGKGIDTIPQPASTTIEHTIDHASSDRYVSEKNKKRNDKLKQLFKCIIEKSVAKHLSADTEAEKLFSNICLVIDNREIEDVPLEKVKNHDLSNEDLFHLGFALKYYLRKDNDFGATFIYKVFEDDFKKDDGVEYSVVCSKLAANEAQSHFIELPPSRRREGNSRSKSIADKDDIEKDLQLFLA